MNLVTNTTVAVIGAGPAGLSMLKTLRSDGFATTLFERRDKVGGLWAYSDNPNYTTALPRTRANISKFTCGYTDFPMPDRFPPYLKQQQFQDFMQDYAEHFDLLKSIKFNSTVRSVHKKVDDRKWLLEVERNASTEMLEFDKVVFCHGYQTLRKLPKYADQDQYTGNVMHSQEYRRPEQFKDAKVVVIGLSGTTSDIVPDLLPFASKIYISHRRGALPVRRLRNGSPADLLVTWRRRVTNQWIMAHFPRLHKLLADVATKYLAKSLNAIPLDPAWRLQPFPSVLLKLPGVLEEILPILADGRAVSMPGIKKFTGGRGIEFEDGTVLEDVDAVIFCSGYQADFSVAPFIERSRPSARGYRGPSIPRLYMNTFPPKHADSCAMLCYSAYGKNNGFSFSDVLSQSVSNVWRGVSSDMLPSCEQMEAWVYKHHEWVAGRWVQDSYSDVSAVKQWEFQPWHHRAAGTGMENLGWGWKGWAFWLQDRKMYKLMNHGVETAHMFRYFETGKRAVWPGARQEIIHQNAMVEKFFPLNSEDELELEGPQQERK